MIPLKSKGRAAFELATKIIFGLLRISFGNLNGRRIHRSPGDWSLMSDFNSNNPSGSGQVLIRFLVDINNFRVVNYVIIRNKRKIRSVSETSRSRHGAF